jgi:hypothetical protein
LCALLGLAYDLKTASRQSVLNKQIRSGESGDNKKNTALYELFTGTIVITMPLWLMYALRVIFA